MRTDAAARVAFEAVGSTWGINESVGYLLHEQASELIERKT